MAVEELTIVSADGIRLEGEVATASSPFAAVVLCHPHPRYGGSMRAGVIGDLFRALPERGVTALRFNFRGVERSTGQWDGGRAERDDVASAVEALAARVPPTLPLLLVGWSFGADMALSTLLPRVGGWCAIAPPLRFASALDAIGADARPKHVVLGARDDVVSADDVEARTREWQATTVVVIPGASHFFVGTYDAVVTEVFDFCARAAP